MDEELKEYLKVSINRVGPSAKIYLSRPPHERDPITGHLQWMKGHNSRAAYKNRDHKCRPELGKGSRLTVLHFRPSEKHG